MRIHSDILTRQDIYTAVDNLPGVYVDVTEHGSRTHAAAYEVSLEGNGYAKNTGKYGAGDEIAATWDEWGVFLARLFDKDPDARCGAAKYPAYRNGYDFHAQTNDRFANLELPADTHKRHNFRSDIPGQAACTKCSAVKIWSY